MTSEAHGPGDTRPSSSISSITDGLSGGTSLTSDSTSITAAAHLNYVAKSYLQKNELVTEVQRLRIELKRKADELEHVRAQLVLAADDNDDKVDELRRENARLKQALAHDDRLANDEVKRHDEVMKRELSTLVERVRALEALNLRLANEQAAAKQHFRLIRLTEDEYNELKAAELKEELSLSEMVSIRVFEELRGSLADLVHIEDEKKRLEEANRSLKSQLGQIQVQFDDTSTQIDQLKWTNSKLEKRLASLLGSGAAHEPMYDPATSASKQPCSSWEGEISRLRSQLDSVTQHLSSERERLVKELDTAREALRVAVDEGNALRRQAIDAGQRSVFLEERVASLSTQLDTLKHGREELLEKYLSSKEEARAEFNGRLNRELDELRSKSSTEYERIHKHMKEVCEQENASLRSARDSAIAERDRAIAGEADARARYEKVLVEFKQLEFSLESQTADLISQLRVKTYELERLRTLIEETDSNLRSSKDSYESLREKFDALVRDHQTYISESAFAKKKLEDDLETARQKLSAFERTETDLDDLVMQAADTGMGNEAERVLMSYGAVAAVPPSFRRRLEQSVRLARRVLELERVNNVLRADYEKKSSDATRLSQEVSDLNSLLSLSRHPDQKLIVEALRAKDEEMRSLKARIFELEAQLDATRHEMMALSKQKDEMAKDMHTLINHREELVQIRHQLHGNGRPCQSPASSSKKTPRSQSRDRRPSTLRKAAVNAHNHNISPPVLLS